MGHVPQNVFLVYFMIIIAQVHNLALINIKQHLPFFGP